MSVFECVHGGMCREVNVKNSCPMDSMLSMGQLQYTEVHSHHSGSSGTDLDYASVCVCVCKHKMFFVSMCVCVYLCSLPGRVLM